MRTETVTDGMYTRAFMLEWSLFLIGFQLILAGGMGMLYLPATVHAFAGAMVMFLFGGYLWTAAYAVKKRGVWYHVWSIGGDIPWTRDDIDTDEFVDGPVEVEVPE